MTLEELLAERGIRNALIVDDVCDLVPKATDVGTANEAWAVFNDDLSQEQRNLIADRFPRAAEERLDELIIDDGYVAALWGMRAELGEVGVPLFEAYVADQAADEKFVRLAREKLEAVGLTCEMRGRDFGEQALQADIIVIDLFFGGAQNDAALEESKTRLRDALEPRSSNPPLVILMSRSNRLEGKRDEFRDDVGLIESAFRIIKKSDLEENDRLERQLERLADNAADSQKLAQFFAALESGMSEATHRTLGLLRKLKLSDIGQIQQLVLSAEGEPTGSYLVDVFDRVLQHEIEADAGIIDAALALNEFSAVQHPPPYVAGSAELQNLVQRLLTQNQERLRLPGSIDVLVTFGDVLRMADDKDAEQVKNSLLVDLNANNLLLVLTPVCDLQRGGAPRILLLVGTLKALEAKDWSYGSDARTPSIMIDGALHWVRWNLKHIDTVSWGQLEGALQRGDIRVVARLREAHALELQQRVLSGLGRVGLVATLPATFPVEVEAFYADTDGKPARLEVPALADGAVCFVGRDENGNQVIRLVVTEGACDGIEVALAALPTELVAEAAQKALGHIRGSSDLRRMLAAGLDLKNVGQADWTQLASETGQPAGVPKMGLIAWNYEFPDKVIKTSHLNKAGIILLLKDADAADTPGLDDAIQSGMIVSEIDIVDADDEVQS